MQTGPAMTNDEIIKRILASEGGFTNNPADRGGPTNFGITASELGRARNLNRPATVDEVKALTIAEASQIYERKYISDPGFGQITDANLRLILVDSGVLHGTGRAIKWLQTALGVTVDGVLGQQTLSALQNASADVVARGVLALRFKFVGALLSRDHSQVVFAAGWLNRIADLLQFA